MRGYIGRRALVFFVTLLIGSLVVYSALYFSPGSPVDLFLGGRPATEEVRAAIAQRYNLDEPFPVRYANWLGNAIRGDFGESAQSGEPVSDLIRTRAQTTLLLAGMAILLVTFFGILLGRVAALRAGPVDAGVSGVLIVALATPGFIFAVVLLSVFAVRLGWFPAFGDGSGFLDRLYHLTLPAIALAIGWLAFVAQATRQGMREELGKEHVVTARARGLAPRHVTNRHVFRNALIPITTAVGLAVGGLIAGTAIVEITFSLNGLGSLLVSSITQKDFSVAQALLLLVLVLYAVVNLVVDLLYGVLDPRLRSNR